jgi:hypothetical protein
LAGVYGVAGVYRGAVAPAYNVDFDFTGGNDNVTINHGGGGPGGNTTTFNAGFEIKRFTSPPQ